jgi:hypothetical protein
VGLGRLVYETLWLPSCLLAKREVSWKAFDDEPTRATAKIGGEPVVINLFIELDGMNR